MCPEKYIKKQPRNKPYSPPAGIKFSLNHFEGKMKAQKTGAASSTRLSRKFNAMVYAKKIEILPTER